MTKQIEAIMALADEWADQCGGCDSSHLAENSPYRKALRQALEAALGQPQAVPASNGDQPGLVSTSSLKPGHEADVWHEGSQSFYRAKLLYKLTPEEVDAAPPAQTPPKATAVEACIKAVEDAFAWTGGHGEPSKPGPYAIANIIRSHFHVAQTPPPRLTDDTITIAYQMGSNHSDGLRNIETAVRKQFGYE